VLTILTFQIGLKYDELFSKYKKKSRDAEVQCSVKYYSSFGIISDEMQVLASAGVV
jgi:hypothetical protein